MAKILIAGAGGAPSEGVIKSLQYGNSTDLVYGMGSEPTDLVLSSAEKKFFIPYADSKLYKGSLLRLLKSVRPDLLHFQNDLEIYNASLFKDEILSTGVKLFMPEHDVIDTCVHKYKSYLAFEKAGLKVPKNIMINDKADLRDAFEQLGDESGRIWLRASSIGGGGKGSIPTADYDMACACLDH